MTHEGNDRAEAEATAMMEKALDHVNVIDATAARACARVPRS